MDWAEKYRPKHLADLVGNKESMRQMVQWAQNWTVRSEPLLIYGKPGVGKTSSAFALATDMGWEVVDLNASDQRTKSVIERVAGTSASTGSLIGSGRKLIILDEADNLQGNSDRGGARAIVEVIKKASQPIIIIANDLYGLDPAIRNLCEKVLFKASMARSIAPRLKEICINEGVSCDISAINEISEQASGDIRSAVTMLYAATIGKSALSEEGCISSKKDARSTIFDLVSATITSKSSRSLMDLSFEVEDTPDTVMQWIESNLGLMKNLDAIAGSYHALSRSDEYLGRTIRSQYYTLWRYATAMMLLGVKSNAPPHSGFMKIMPPERWKKLAAGKRQKVARQQLLDRLGLATHMASYTIRGSYLPLFSMMARRDPIRYAEGLNLDLDQLDLLIQDSDISKETIKRMNEKRKAAEREEKAALKEEKAQSRTVKKTQPGKVSSPLVSESEKEPQDSIPGIQVTTTVPVLAGSERTADTDGIIDGESSGNNLKKVQKKTERGEKSATQSTLFNFGG